MKKKNWILLIGIITLVIAIVGVSYAYFSANITGNESSTTVSVSGGTLGLTVNGGNSISVSNVIPQDDPIATKTFTLTGNDTTNLTMPYTISLIIDANTFSAGSIKYTLTSTNTDNNGTIVTSITAQTNIATGASTITLGSGNFTKGTNKVHTYVLNFYFPSTTKSQNANQGKSLSAHISVAQSKAEDTMTPTLLSTRILGENNSKVSETLTTPGQTISTSSEAVLASTTDDYGTSYYYRGAVENNYIVFANMCWRIVRVVGDGSIKLVLYNFNSNSVSNPCDVTQDATLGAFAHINAEYTSVFNSSKTDNTYVGLMYGTAGASTYAETHANTNKSTILTYLETWYTSKLSSYSSYLADTIWCNDKSMSTDSTYLGYGTNSTYYKAYQRLSSVSTAAPSLICPIDTNGGSLSKLTVDDTTNGNGDLTYKIGLLTADEVAYAGAVSGTKNSTYYLYNNASAGDWWTMSSGGFNSSIASVFYVKANSGFADLDVSGHEAVRPAVSLISTTIVTGSGTTNDPYTIQ